MGVYLEMRTKVAFLFSQPVFNYDEEYHSVYDRSQYQVESEYMTTGCFIDRPAYILYLVGIGKTDDEIRDLLCVFSEQQGEYKCIYLP
jgi:hypothetical protein